MNLSSLFRFAVSSGIAFVANLGLTAALHELVGLPPKLAYLITLCCVLLLNFYMLRYFVFPDSNGKPKYQLAVVAISSIAFRIIEYFSFLLLVVVFQLNYLFTITMVLTGMFLVKHVYYRWLFSNANVGGKEAEQFDN